jgi:hypothetical protein
VTPNCRPLPLPTHPATQPMRYVFVMMTGLIEPT